MPRVTKPAAKVLDFFQSQPFAVAETIFSLVRAIMHERAKAESPPRKRRRKVGVSATPPPSEATPLGAPAPKVRRKRRTKAEIEEANRRISAMNASVSTSRPPRPPRPPGLVESVGEEGA